uniref:RNA-directed DNA polymerase, eukaryota n=1 Tax=Tanacetum cinerariifolium TaxID=118510 RepID=A0A6L2P1U9_TANCI|nr:RNA-directed DNA polymerase, eukaryota [Tanacetum cinerariifolium]
MGLAVSIEKVEEVTRHIGCGILNTLFSFLGSKVGGYMSQIKSWHEVSRFFNPSDSLWVRVIHAILGVDGRIGRARNVGYTSMWCDIIKEMDRLASHGIDLTSRMHKKIGNGLNTSFWEDRMPRSGIESEQWDHLLDYLEGVMLNPLEDRWSWDLNGSGEFSVASARRYIDNNKLPDISSKTRWIKEVPIKVNVHAWKVRINGLLTRWNISRRGIDIPTILCPLCETGVESLKHLFFNCSVVRAIFRRVCIWWDVSYMTIDSFDEWISWITNLRLPSKHKSILEGVCYGLWWLIWAFQNKKIFGVVPSSKANIFDDLVTSSFFWCRFRCKATFSWVDWLKNPHLVSL